MATPAPTAIASARCGGGAPWTAPDAVADPAGSKGPGPGWGERSGGGVGRPWPAPGAALAVAPRCSRNKLKRQSRRDLVLLAERLLAGPARAVPGYSVRSTALILAFLHSRPGPVEQTHGRAAARRLNRWLPARSPWRRIGCG